MFEVVRTGSGLVAMHPRTALNTVPRTAGGFCLNLKSRKVSRT